MHHQPPMRPTTTGLLQDHVKEMSCRVTRGQAPLLPRRMSLGGLYIQRQAMICQLPQSSSYLSQTMRTENRNDIKNAWTGGKRGLMRCTL